MELESNVMFSFSKFLSQIFVILVVISEENRHLINLFCISENPKKKKCILNEKQF